MATQEQKRSELADAAPQDDEGSSVGRSARPRPSSPLSKQIETRERCRRFDPLDSPFAGDLGAHGNLMNSDRILLGLHSGLNGHF